jgi:hypothetical protein
MLQREAGLVIGFLLCVLAFNSDAGLTRPVIEQGQRTEVRIVGAILDVDKIDSAEQNFTLNFYTIIRWNDPRLAHAEPGNVVRRLSEVWNPRLTIANTQRHWANTRDEVEISPEGEVTYRLHVFGDFSQPLDLHDFPQDSHVFEVPVVAAGYRPDEVVLLPEPRMDSFINDRLSVADWQIGEIETESREFLLANRLQASRFRVQF